MYNTRPCCKVLRVVQACDQCKGRGVQLLSAALTANATELHARVPLLFPCEHL